MDTNDASIAKTPRKANTEPPSSSHLSRDLKAVIDDAEALLNATANQGGEKLDELRARARQSLRAARLRLEDAQREIASKSRNAAKGTNAYVHAHPWRAIGTVAAGSLIIGLLLRRR
ncbi:DUF883 family protein [Pseudomarimonas salicorniae]|uniref:DUF883 family protein n=1 Tax=Pseudomarimonas salicorniae TaxID=2933270 RepID=A0ABT0GJA8_9GAMM|nr:DUF883 family protein [Lysobacter sp. CAU 1642]MCK7594635.1 DUF883 family protein [Lysobacter sp. CAU 1642]